MLVLLLRWRVENVVDPLHEAPEQLQLQARGDEAGKRLEEAGAERGEGEHPPDTEIPVQDLCPAYGENGERRGHPQPGDGGLGERLEATARQRDVDLVHEQVRPMRCRTAFRSRGLQILDSPEQLVDVTLGAGLNMEARRHQSLVSPTREHEYRHLQYAEAEHEQPHRRTQREEDEEIEAGERAIEQRRERAGREDLANVRVAAQPHGQVACRALEEEGVRKVDEVLHETERQLHVEL